MLCWDDVDLNDRVLNFRRVKGGSSYALPIWRDLLIFLANLPREEGQEHVLTYVHQKTGERLPITTDGWRKVWARAKKDAGITEPFRPHDLRHTAGTRAARNGDIRIAQKLLGHADISSTMRYAHTFASDLEEAMNQRVHPEYTQSGMDCIKKVK